MQVAAPDGQRPGSPNPGRAEQHLEIRQLDGGTDHPEETPVAGTHRPRRYERRPTGDARHEHFGKDQAGLRIFLRYAEIRAIGDVGVFATTGAIEQISGHVDHPEASHLGEGLAHTLQFALDRGSEMVRLRCLVGLDRNPYRQIAQRCLDPAQRGVETGIEHLGLAAGHQLRIGPDIPIRRPQNVGEQEETADHQGNQRNPQTVPIAGVLLRHGLLSPFVIGLSGHSAQPAAKLQSAAASGKGASCRYT